MLKICLRLCRNSGHMQMLHAAGMPSVLSDVITSALLPNVPPKKVFSLLKNAFFSIDILLLCMETSPHILEEQKSRGMVSWGFECCKQFVERHGALAWSAMEEREGKTKVCLERKAFFALSVQCRHMEKLLVWRVHAHARL